MALRVNRAHHKRHYGHNRPIHLCALCVHSGNDVVLKTAVVSAIVAERNLTIVLPQKIQEPLVIARLHIEETRHDPIIAARFLEPAADDLANVGARDIPVHIPNPAT